MNQTNIFRRRVFFHFERVSKSWTIHPWPFILQTCRITPVVDIEETIIVIIIQKIYSCIPIITITIKVFGRKSLFQGSRFTGCCTRKKQKMKTSTVGIRTNRQSINTNYDVICEKIFNESLNALRHYRDIIFFFIPYLFDTHQQNEATKNENVFRNF